MAVLSTLRQRFNGALDIIIVEQKDGSFKSSGWYLHRRLFSAGVKKNSVVKIAIGNHEVDRFEMAFGKFCKDGDGVAMYFPDSYDLALISRRLQEGRNDVKFYLRDRPDLSFTTRIFLWNWNVKIVCTDVDGTLTRSNIRGIFSCYMGINWMRDGVAGLFSCIEGKGYQFLYVTARRISMIESTKKYLAEHEDQVGRKLPDGPVITSCHGRILTFARHFTHSHADFKTACLLQIRNLFREYPFYAAFGDRKSDIKSYRKVRIPENTTFHIKKRGAVVLYEDEKVSVKFSSYRALHNFIGKFPEVNTRTN